MKDITDMWSKLVDVIQIMDAKMTRIEVDMKAIRKDLKFHIRRSDLNEAALEKIENHVNTIEDEVVRPLQNDILKFKIIGGIIVTIGLGLCGLVGWLINTLLTMKAQGLI